ncbi:hypothetical protein [Sphingobium yanoikuyae]
MMKSICTFALGWIGAFLAVTAAITVLFGIMYVCAMAMYWGNRMPPAPWFLWRFFVAFGFFFSLVGGFAALSSAKRGKGK